MNTATTAASRGLLRHRLVGPALAALLALTVPASALAQDPDADFAFPVTLDGLPLDVETFSGAEYIAQFSGGEATDTTFIEGTEGLVEGVGRSIDDLTVKSALFEPSEGNHAAVVGFQIDGAEARDFATDAARLLLGDVETPGFVLRPVAGKWALRVVDATMPGVYPRTLFLKDDTAWIIEGDEPYVWDVLDQLPDVPQADSVVAADLASNLPLQLDGRRRTGLYEATEPLFLPTLSQNLGAALETWLVDAYLDGGLTPAEMIGAITWWGIESSEDSVQIEGYQLPAASPELIEQLYREVILNDGTELPEGITRSDGAFGGREVTTIDFVTSKQHMFVSGDTIWIVTDHVGEPEMAEEAVAALP